MLSRFCAAVVTVGVFLSTQLQAAPGDLVPSFGIGGVAELRAPEGSEPAVSSILLDQNSRLWLGGTRQTGGNGQFQAWRFTQDGQPDTSFANDFGRQISTTGFSAGVSVTLQELLPIPNTTNYFVVGLSRSTPGVILFARYFSFGNVDTSFGINGAVQLAASSFGLSSIDSARLFLLINGQIVVLASGASAQSFSPTIVLTKLFPTGGFDTTFGSAGFLRLSVAPTTDIGGYAAVTQGDNLVVAVNLSNNVLLTRVNLLGGRIDSTFGVQGVTSTGIITKATNLRVRAMRLTQDSGFVIAGSANVGTNQPDVLILRFLPTGLLDTRFNGDGVLTVNPYPGEDNTETATDVLVQQDGKFVYVGRGKADALIAGRVGPTGFVDSGFGASGLATIGQPRTASPDHPVRVTTTPDGGIVVSSVMRSSPTAPVQSFLFKLDPGVFGLDNPNDRDGDGFPDLLEAANGLNPTVKDNDVFRSNKFLVMQQYRDFLGREADASGLTFFEGQITSGALRKPAFIFNYLTAPEFDGLYGAVARLYLAYFNRQSDVTGLQFWAGQLQETGSLEAVSNAFAGSQEFIDRYGQVNNSQFVTLVYINVLRRSPDSAGLNFWTTRLGSGVTRGAMMSQFSESVEYKSLVRADVTTTLIYFGMLRRQPDTAGFTFWRQQVANGSGEQLVNAFFTSREYCLRFLPAGSCL